MEQAKRQLPAEKNRRNWRKSNSLNIGADKANRSADVYEVTDMAPAEDDADILVFTWTVSGNATMHAGSLNCRIKFACTDENGNYTYKKWTDVYKGITIGDSFDNGAAIEQNHSDILAQWEARITAQESKTAPWALAESTKANPVALTSLATGVYFLKGYFKQGSWENVNNDNWSYMANIAQATVSGERVTYVQLFVPGRHAIHWYTINETVCTKTVKSRLLTLAF